MTQATGEHIQNKSFFSILLLRSERNKKAGTPLSRRRETISRFVSRQVSGNKIDKLTLENPWPKQFCIDASLPKTVNEYFTDLRSPPNWKEGKGWSDATFSEIFQTRNKAMTQLYLVFTSADDLYDMQIHFDDENQKR